MKRTRDPFIDVANCLSAMVSHVTTSRGSSFGNRQSRVCECMQQRGITYCKFYDGLFRNSAYECMKNGLKYQLN
jgi:hypothetical protein